MTVLLDRLARHHGITLAYVDPFNSGEERRVPDHTLNLILGALGVNVAAEPQGDPAPQRMQVPRGARCWLPPSLEHSPGWGVFCQLYELRSARNWGIGDFADLAAMARLSGAAGADFLGVNPVHALFLSDPDRRSPFSPSNRRFLNPLYIAPDLIPGVDEPAAVAALRARDLLDYPTIARTKIAALRAAFDAGAPTDGLEIFASAGGEALRLHALFEAISARMVDDGHGAGWQSWPDELKDPSSAAVAALAGSLDADVRFHLWLQMIARQQLSEASAAARKSGMRIGLYLDLAVGEAPDGSSTWSGAAADLPGLRIGAPPDMFAAEGQNWGLAAPSPTALKQSGFRAFREMILAQLCDAGAIRIDHAMALWQLFVIPEGDSPMAGTHLRYPFPDLVRVLCELSCEHRSVVIGEDLGFVPEGFRRTMAKANVLSYRILVFEQDDKGFKGRSRYPVKAFACLSTHDLPVLSAWWRGDDVARRRDFGLVDAAQSAAEALSREAERRALIRRLRQARVLADRPSAEAPDLPDGVLDAAHRFLARTPCLLVGVRLADLVGPVAPTNVPGTVDDYPNWRPRSPVDISNIAAHPVFVATTALMRDERPRPLESEE